MLTTETFLIGLLVSSLMVFLTVFIHYEGLNLIGRLVNSKVTGKPRRVHLLLIILGVIFLHVIEIWLYAGCFWFVAEVGKWGDIIALPGIELSSEPFRYVYFSAVSYTSLGYGDVLPVGAIRMISGAEVLNGLLLIAWSASYTFVMMERLWQKRTKK